MIIENEIWLDDKILKKDTIIIPRTMKHRSQTSKTKTVLIEMQTGILEDDIVRLKMILTNI